MDSFNHIKDWLDDVNKVSVDDPIKLIIGNKFDLEERKITKQDLKVKN